MMAKGKYLKTEEIHPGQIPNWLILEMIISGGNPSGWNSFQLKVFRSHDVRPW